jgi:diaminohydroxyphosphoribosylaminopyrimidine deaminase/5-amino-6-(5-phosphoribosylamino)uracil reductase
LTVLILAESAATVMIPPMSDAQYMRLALRLARKGFGATSPNPMVGAVLVKGRTIIGRGWHRCAGLPHAEIEALRNAAFHGRDPRGATLYVTLEPCSSHGRTPPCTDAIISAGIRRVVIGATDPNPKHRGKGFKLLRRAGIKLMHGVLADECAKLNEAFNHWIVHRTPFVTVKAGMTLDGKIATADGESRWVTGEHARALAMTWRQGMDAILVGVNTILLDDPSLTFRPAGKQQPKALQRIVLDSMARTPLTAKVVSDEFAAFTTIVVGKKVPKKRATALSKKVRVIVAPLARSGIDLRWLMKRLGAENVTRLLVEGGGEVNASFLFGGLAQRVTFFYAPKILGGDARKGVAGDGVKSLKDALQLKDVEWKKAGEDLLLTANLA